MSPVVRAEERFDALFFLAVQTLKNGKQFAGVGNVEIGTIIPFCYVVFCPISHGCDGHIEVYLTRDDDKRHEGSNLLGQFHCRWRIEVRQGMVGSDHIPVLTFLGGKHRVRRAVLGLERKEGLLWIPFNFALAE